MFVWLIYTDFTALDVLLQRTLTDIINGQNWKILLQSCQFVLQLKLHHRYRGRRLICLVWEITVTSSWHHKSRRDTGCSRKLLTGKQEILVEINLSGSSSFSLVMIMSMMIILTVFKVWFTTVSLNTICLMSDNRGRRWTPSYRGD